MSLRGTKQSRNYTEPTCKFDLHWRRGCHAIARHDIVFVIGIIPLQHPLINATILFIKANKSYLFNAFIFG